MKHVEPLFGTMFRTTAAVCTSAPCEFDSICVSSRSRRRSRRARPRPSFFDTSAPLRM